MCVLLYILYILYIQYIIYCIYSIICIYCIYCIYYIYIRENAFLPPVHPTRNSYRPLASDVNIYYLVSMSFASIRYQGLFRKLLHPRRRSMRQPKTPARHTQLSDNNYTQLSLPPLESHIDSALPISACSRDGVPGTKHCRKQMKFFTPQNVT